MDLNQDERRLVRFFRCLTIERQDQVLYEIASQAVNERLHPDLIVNGFAALMPKPSEGGVRGDIWEDHSIDHLLCCGIEATGEPSEVLLGSSYWDEEETIPRIIHAAAREAERQGNYSFDTGPEFARNLLNDWRFAIVQACEEVAAQQPKETYR